jgi:hypothetical protein
LALFIQWLIESPRFLLMLVWCYARINFIQFSFDLPGAFHVETTAACVVAKQGYSS